MGPTFVDRLHPLVVTGDVAGVQTLLASLTDEEHKAAKKWFETSRRWWSELSWREFEDDDSRRHFERWLDRGWFQSLCAVDFCGPALAARLSASGQPGSGGEQALVGAVSAKPREWAALYLEAASQPSGGLDAPALRAIGQRLTLPCPTGPNLYTWQWAGPGERPLADRLREDPWMPDLLYHFMASGNCGQQVDLAEAVATLIADDTLDRDELLARLFPLLTAPQRVGSQRVLAKVLAVLAPRTDEIPGGLDYLLGVISTSTGTIGKLLLPLALDLVADAEDLAQVTAVLASRPEKQQKAQLLTALRTLGERVGTPAVLASLDALATDEDAAFAGRARTLANQLGAAAILAEPAPGAAPVLGLWDVEPTRHEPIMYRIENRWSVEREVYWPDFLTVSGRAGDVDQRVLVNEVLTALAEGRSDHLDSVMDIVRALLSGGDLVPSRFTNLLPDLFFEGGLREVWPRALDFADTCAARLAPPAGLAVLLRTLARFAAEVPHQELPAHLAQLAARKGNSKAQVEARVLGAALLGVPVEEYRARLAATPPSVPERTPRGLWRDQRPAVTLPQDTPLPPPEWTPEQLVHALRFDAFSYDESHYPLCLYPEGSPLRNRPDAWTQERALAATVRAVHQRGGEPVRGSLVDIRRRREPLPILAAVDLWAGGRLDASTYWRIATHSEFQPAQMSLLTRGIWELEWGRVGDLEGFSKALSRDPELPLLRPTALEYPVQLAMFLRACECLLLAGSSPVVLSTPTWCDGTLELDDLLTRLEATGAAGVGPLDLVQALYRLRPVERSRAEEIPMGKWFTAAALTNPDGVARLDAGALVRQWVDAGGLPPLQCTPGEWSWTFAGEAPVPWSTCAAAPAEFDAKGPRLGSSLDVLRTFPLWPDLAGLYYGSRHPEEHFPAGARGPFGEMLHTSLLNQMSQQPERKGHSHLATFLLLARSGRLDAEVVARVLAAPRQVRGRHHRHASDEIGAWAHTFGSIFEEGGMVGAWPSALEVAVAGTRAADTAGLAELLRMLASYAVEVPRPRAAEAVVEVLRAFAEEPAKDAAHAQARILVDALEEA